MIRALQIGTLVFWLATMGWLAKTILTPDEAGMVEVDPRRPVRIFFDWNDTNRMVLLQNGRKLGELQMVGFSEDEEGGLAGFSTAIMLNGDVEGPVVGTFGRGLFKFNDDFSLESSDFLFRMPSNNFKILASARKGSEVVKAEVSLAGNKIFSYDGEDPNAVRPDVEQILKGNTMATELLSKTGAPTDWKWKVEAFRGRHLFAGKRLPVYLIRLSMDQTEQNVRIYLSESGEPLKIETDLGFQAVSEILAPIEKRPLKREEEFR
ncbi:MAG: hypothetical protein P1U89_14195 [Verrucomicrobiales bacterium]|nr:hypothetical protein [Verrucomicrobiales bacterium]